LFIAVLFSLFLYNSLFCYNSENLGTAHIPTIHQKLEQFHGNNKHTNHLYRQFLIEPRRSRVDWSHLNWVSKDSALFERHKECRKWTHKDYVIAVIHLCCQEVSYRDDNAASLHGFNIFYSDGRRHFYLHRNDEERILNQINLYEYEEFRKMVSHFAGYEKKVQELHNLIHENKRVEANISAKLHNAIAQVCREIEERNLREKKEHEQAARKRSEQERERVQDTFHSNLDIIIHEAQSWNDLLDIAGDYGLSNANLEKRVSALEAIQGLEIEYAQLHYTLNVPARELIGECNYNPNDFTTHYGNQLQHVVHQECIALVNQAAQLKPQDNLYEYRKDFMDCVDASREFNQTGLTHKATTINDFCWTLLDIGRAIAHGVCSGVYYAAHDLATHPVQTGLCLVAGEYVLAYQVCKLVYAVADVAVTSYYDRDAGYEKLDAYLAPVDALLTQLENGIKLRDAVQIGTHVAVGWYAQGKMLKGLNSIYSKTRTRAVDFIKKYPQAEPELFLATPEGMLLKSTVNEGGKHCESAVHSIDNSAHCLIQYEKLKNALRVEEFTSIIKVTKHGLKRLIERGFTPEEIKALVQTPDIIKIQLDGAKTFIKQIGENRYNFMVYNIQKEKVVTALKKISKKDIINLSKNYGWEI
jgi:hypothetical protein